MHFTLKKYKLIPSSSNLDEQEQRPCILVRADFETTINNDKPNHIRHDVTGNKSEGSSSRGSISFFFLKGSQNIRPLSPRSRTSQRLSSRPGNLGVCGAVESSANEITSLHHFGKTHSLEQKQKRGEKYYTHKH